MPLKPIQFILFSFLLLLTGCIVQFIPETDENQELLVVEGLITDQPYPNTIKLSTSLPLGEANSAKPLVGCKVSISDDLGENFNLLETVPGTFITPGNFLGMVGRSYTLHIKTGASNGNLNYESIPMKMLPCPPIDSIYYEKKAINFQNVTDQDAEGCNIYLDTHDPENQCDFYRWEYSETWEFRLPYMVPNNTCWISSNSDRINIKSTASLTRDRITRYPLNYVSNATDRLKFKYSMLVNQYSLTEDEFTYWEKLQNISDNVGGLYDITPASIPSNIWCVDAPGEKVLGYFSVSATSSKRIFIKDKFKGIVDLYTSCIADTIYPGTPIQNLGTYVWVIIDYQVPTQSYKVTTRIKGCYDCSVRGTTIEPFFWRDDQ